MISYYREELGHLHQFVKDQAEFNQYCFTGSTVLDDRYFVRGFVPLTDFITDRMFSTYYDDKLSQLIANKMLRHYLESSISNHEVETGMRLVSSLTWTGSKADLIELIYGLEAIGALNEGKADIKKIAVTFENMFNISLGNYYRQFLDIRLRKKEKTTFLTEMKQKLEVRINDFN